MEFSRFHAVVPKPCACCSARELSELEKWHAQSTEDYWVYRLPVARSCGRCKGDDDESRRKRYDGGFLYFAFCVYCFATQAMYFWGLVTICISYWVFRPISEKVIVEVPLPITLVGNLERGIHSASVATKGGDMKAHSHFINELAYLGCGELRKQALCAWAPSAMMCYLSNVCGVSRSLSLGRPSQPVVNPPNPFTDPSVANPDTDGSMIGTRLKGDEFGEEERVIDKPVLKAFRDEKVLAMQTGPDLIPTEVMDSSTGNLKAGLAKRVKPLPFKADKALTRRIEKTVNALIKNVFSKEKIIEWRQQHPSFDECASRKWSTDRWHRAVEAALIETHTSIKQQFQVKSNEALPAKDKAPRPIIASGDKGQVVMTFAVKCFEDILFHHFEGASIKHVSKYAAMERVSKHLRQKGAKIVGGDGSSWDACCNSTIRKMTENRIMAHIISVLGSDPEVPEKWLIAMAADMNKEIIAGKMTTDDMSLVRIFIESIRQSGHRGTSCFNWLINFICWISILCEDPASMMPRWNKKTRKYDLPTSYKTLDGLWAELRYIFEGDDSALSTTENLNVERIVGLWTGLGFRMKLDFATGKFTFTGFDFLCDDDGPTGVFLPEIARNIASSSWSTSSELKSHPNRVHKVGAAAMLARAENFKDCGPLSKYFAEIGLAHIRKGGDFGLEESDAVRLGLSVSQSVHDDLQHLATTALPMTKNMKNLVRMVVPDFAQEHEIRCLGCSFDDPTDVTVAKKCIPFSLWDPEQYCKARR